MICHFKPFPVISTERLVLRQTESSDAFDVFKMRNHPDMHLYTDSIPDETIDQTYQYLKRIETGSWSIEYIKPSFKVLHYPTKRAFELIGTEMQSENENE